MAKYEVQKGRTVTCMMGVAHEGGKLELANFSGSDDKAKQAIIDTLVDIGALKEVPLTEEEAEALAEAEEKREKAKEEVERRRLKALAEAEANAKKEAEAKAKREAAVLEADFDSMNKDPMIAFSKEHGIELQSSTANEIREELKKLQESLTAPE